MDNFKNSGLNSAAMAAISGGITILIANPKWYVGLILVVVGLVLNDVKYKLRGCESKKKG